MPRLHPHHAALLGGCAGTLVLCASPALADTTYQSLPFSQNWSNAALINVANDWSGVPGIMGYRGDDLTAATGVDPQTVLAFGTGVINVNANQTNPNTNTAGGLAEFAITDPVVAMQGSGTADAPFLLLHLNTSGKSNIVFSCNLRDIDGSTDNAVQAIAIQYRIGESGDFTNLPAGFVADATTGPSLADLVTPVSVTLPAACDNQSQLQIRVITTNAVGNDEWVGVDDISVTGDTAGVSYSCGIDPPSQALGTGDLASFTYTLIQDPGSTGVPGITVDLLVTSGPDTGATASGVTDGAGQVILSYLNGGFPGTDQVQITAQTEPNPTVCAASASFTAPTTPLPVTINELDSDTPGTDVAEFIELYDGGTGNTPLDGLVVVFWNGSNNQSYAAFDLDGKSTDANGYFLLGNASVTSAVAAANSLTFNDNLLQNGEDAVALYNGNASDFPNGTSVTTANLRDAVVYDTNDPDSIGLLPLLNAGQPQINEAGGGNSGTQSIQRCPNGSGGLRNTVTFVASAPTPMASNTYTNVPGNIAANPNPVCAGEAVTLTATAGSDEVVVWHEGDANGPVVGSGLSVQVTPATDTTYVAVCTQPTAGCTSSNSGSVGVTLSAPSVWYADQDGDGAGDPANTVVACSAPPGYVGVGGDGCPKDPNKIEPGACGCGVADTDTDGDGAPDCVDGCPNDPKKTNPGACGCGVADTDTDGDGVADCLDGCPSDPNKTAPGACGCGVADTDTDGDGVPDCLDGCPEDPNKTAPGTCGCGVADTDTDGDGVADCLDLCPTDPKKTEPGACGCGVPDTDADGDGLPDCEDLCPSDPNKTEPGICGCGTPDVDTDGDGVADCLDLCPGHPDNVDCNGNGVPDGCDISGGTSADLNQNGVPDECECIADLDASGAVDGADLALLLGNWGEPGIGDLDASGAVDGADLAILLGAWGPC